MAKIHSSIDSAVGNTPLIRVENFEKKIAFSTTPNASDNLY